MLVELRVENLLVIERAGLRLGPGLNAVTGETGAGKTVLAHALDLLLGGKPRSGIVRPGAGEAYVEGVFELPGGADERDRLLEGDALADLRERLPAEDGELVLGRRVTDGGRSRAFVGGRSATAADLRELGARLVSFYGQHEHRKLTVASAQLDVLDGFCGPGQLATRRDHAASHARAAELRRELSELRERAGTRERDLDLLVFELEEIEALDPSEEDEAALLAERERLVHLESLRLASGAGAEVLAPGDAEAAGAASLLADAERRLDAVAGVDPALDELAGRLRGLRIEAEDAGRELRRYEEALESEPGRLEAVEARLSDLDRLKRKHGGTVAAVLAHAERCRAERERLEQSEVALEATQKALAAAEADAAERAEALGAARRAAAPLLAERVRSELGALAMADAEFGVELHPREAPTDAGNESVELMLAANPGVPAAPLREVASGGEVSRVMLALMSVGAGTGPGTLAFDEVDAGIGGQTARAVGERLRRLAEGRQVLCITHLPQIASFAHRHFRIEKDTGSELARASVEHLDDRAVLEELCRMLGADPADAGARKHARELLQAA